MAVRPLLVDLPKNGPGVFHISHFIDERRVVPVVGVACAPRLAEGGLRVTGEEHLFHQLAHARGLILLQQFQPPKKPLGQQREIGSPVVA